MKFEFKFEISNTQTVILSYNFHMVDRFRGLTEYYNTIIYYIVSLGYYNTIKYG